MSIDQVVQKVVQSKKHTNLEEETKKQQDKAAAIKGLAAKKDTGLEKTESVGDTVAKQNNKPKEGIIKGDAA